MSLIPIPERTFQFAVQIVLLCQVLERRVGVTRLVTNQLFKSATSVGANVEEAQGAQSPADFLTKNSIALKEAREAHYWLRVLSKGNLYSSEKLAPLIVEADEIIAILTATVKRLKARRDT